MLDAGQIACTQLGLCVFIIQTVFIIHALEHLHVVRCSNQGAVKSALTGKASENVRGRISAIIQKARVPRTCDREIAWPCS